MGSLAIDIETCSPCEEPPKNSNATRYYEWLSVAVAHLGEGQVEPETAVMFRQGGWDEEYTADLFERFVDWCQSLDIDRTLTYNGTWFDLKHMLNWADSLEKTGLRPNARRDLIGCLPCHVDLAKAAADHHDDELWDEQVVLPDWKAYELEGIDNQSIWYDDYDLDPAYREGLGISDDFVKGEHVGRVLGERYVEGVVAGLEKTSTHRELERLLYDYSISDIVDLFPLYESLGGEALDREYHYPPEEIV